VNLGALITAVVKEGGFDTDSAAVSRDTIAGWINDRLKQLVSEAGWIKQAIELGPTVAGQSQYVIPEGVLDVRRVYVNAVPFVRVGTEQVFDARAYGGYVSGDAGGAFAPGYDAAGTAVVELYPTPSEAGLSIQALAAVAAAGLVNDSDVPPIPEEFHPALKAGAIADGLRLIYERHDDADRWELKFSNPGSGQGAVQVLKRRANSRIGSGPVRIRLVG
jgi:hypothetical protein